MNMSAAMKQASKLPPPRPVLEVHGKVEVMLAYMKLHGLQKKVWKWDALVVNLADPTPDEGESVEE